MLLLLNYNEHHTQYLGSKRQFNSIKAYRWQRESNPKPLSLNSNKNDCNP